ncbi:TetR/AcrR family transcriptional regulator [Mangrovibacterium lignilyticum]|uniref:TetR/AcrR family transcriptional regulator n=1 Tax=Mangrovibacterium lignilyticum TaxID=2668052 RepID=UPI0013D59776|nr:TetR/AcrR family transcriptional regulator [Mangrovibacterium lignilyticum]
MSTKDQIVLEAFKLFLRNNYEKVSISDLEHAVGKTRGAIFYFFENKEEIFNQVIDTFIIKTQNPYLKFKYADDISLEQFIYRYVNGINDTMSKMLSLSVINIYKNYFSLYLQAARIYPNFSEIMTQNSIQELGIWKKVISNAIQTKEIKKIEPERYAVLFRSCFLGLAFDRCLSHGLNTEELLRLYLDIYSQIKF